MATLNLGRIKPVFRGAYDNSTAYVVDDIVTSSGETFICILASTGNATSNATYWTKLAEKGTNGSDGTDVGATLLNKEIAFKTNAGAVDGIPIGNAGEFLKVNSGATGYEYGAVSSDFVKIASQTLDATGLATVEFQNCFSSANDTLYGGYLLHAYYQNNGSGNGLNVRYMSGTNTALSGNNAYTRAGHEEYIQTNNSNNSSGHTNDGDGRPDMDWDNWGLNSANNYTEGNFVTAKFSGTMYGNDVSRNCIIDANIRDTSSPSYVVHKIASYRYTNNDNITGLKFYVGGGALSKGAITLWGLKK